MTSWIQKTLKSLSNFKEIAPSHRPHYRQTIVFLTYVEACWKTMTSWIQKTLKFLSKFKEIAPSHRPRYRQTIVCLTYFEAFWNYYDIMNSKKHWNPLANSKKLLRHTDLGIAWPLCFLHILKLFEIIKSKFWLFRYTSDKKTPLTPEAANLGYEIPLPLCSLKPTRTLSPASLSG